MKAFSEHTVYLVDLQIASECDSLDFFACYNYEAKFVDIPVNMCPFFDADLTIIYALLSPHSSKSYPFPGFTRLIHITHSQTHNNLWQKNFFFI